MAAAGPRPNGARPLPQPMMAQGRPLAPYGVAPDAYQQQQQQREAAWYEVEERMRPSYIQGPGYPQPYSQQQQLPQQHYAPQPQQHQAPHQQYMGRPPLSPSARYQQQPPQASAAPGMQAYYSHLPAGAAAPASPGKAGLYSRSPAGQAPGQGGAPSPLQQGHVPIPPPRSYGPASSNPARNSFTGSIAALATSTANRVRKHSNAKDADRNAALLAVPGQQAEENSSWTRGGGQGNKGSAFMHKGFWDIMNLAANPASPMSGGLAPPRFSGQYDASGENSPSGSRPTSPSKLKATIGKATTALRRKSANLNDGGAGAGAGGFVGGAGGEELIGGPSFDMVGPPPRMSMANDGSRPSTPTGAGGLQAPGRLAGPGHPHYASGASGHSFAQHMPAWSGAGGSTASAAPQAVRAAKKRISIDMVGAPQAGTFVHAAHASDADQAEAILKRWSCEPLGVGKIADPNWDWVHPLKMAVKSQQARNQAEAIAQVQAALHADQTNSAIAAQGIQPAPLKIVNGAPSNLSIASTVTPGSTTTIGHGQPVASPVHAFAGMSITEEGTGGAGAQQQDVFSSPRRTASPGGMSPGAPPSPGRLPQRLAAPLKPPMPRSNTAGTLLINPSPGLDAQQAPDYMRYKPAGPPASPRSAAAALVAEQEKRGSKYDGMPGGIGAIFSAPDADRPLSTVYRDTAAAQPGLPGFVSSAAAASAAAEPIGAEDALVPLGANVHPSLTTVEKSVAAKIYFENLYYGILKKPRARDTRRAGLEAELAGLRISDAAKEAIRARWIANETEYLRDVRARVSANSFTKLKTIGHGAFGVVALVRERGTGELFAMKQLRKADMLRKGQEGHVRAERDLMTSASASANARWIVKLVYSFQDVDHLYLIMEFMGGGDLLNLLIEKDIFQEDFARFYVAEMVLAIHEAHRLGYIHRDIKPDNFLFTSQGHVKLADFGLCQSFHWAHDGAYYDQQRKHLLRKHGIDLEDNTAAKRRAAGAAGGAAGPAGGRPRQQGGNLNEKELNDIMSDRNDDGTPMTHVLTWRDKNKKKIAYSVVGTNNYMAPEVLRGLGYDQSCDWWSLGVIVFEMLYGYPPFVSKSRHLTRQKILNWRQTLRFPLKPKISKEAQDFISRLICEKEDRLGSSASASVSRPNSIIQGARRSGFVGGGAAGTGPGLQDGVDELMSHPWFRAVDWGNLHRMSPPFRPALSHPADTKHFEDDIDDEPLPAPGAAEGANPAADQPRDPMLRDKTHGQHLLEMRKQLAFVGYTFKSPKHFDPRSQLADEAVISAAERAAAMTPQKNKYLGEPVLSGSRIRSMSM